MTLGDLIKSYRTAHGLTMQEFASLSGLSKAYVSMLEKNRHPQNNKEIIPSIDTFNKVALAMKLSLNDVLEAVNSNQLINLEHTDDNIDNTSSYSINDEQQRIFTSNLNHYLQTIDKTHREVAGKIGVSPQTFNTWTQGIAMPRMGKIQALADYFGINKSDLIEDRTDKSSNNKSVYTADEAALIDKYRTLNEAGQAKVNDYIDDLSSSGKYTQASVSSLSNLPSYNECLAMEVAPDDDTAANL